MYDIYLVRRYRNLFDYGGGAVRPYIYLSVKIFHWLRQQCGLIKIFFLNKLEVILNLCRDVMKRGPISVTISEITSVPIRQEAHPLLSSTIKLLIDHSMTTCPVGCSESVPSSRVSAMGWCVCYLIFSSHLFREMRCNIFTETMKAE